MASATATRSGKLEGLVFLAHRSRRKFAATEQTQLQCCVSPWLCGCESYFKSEKRRKETRERGEEIQFTATPLSTGKNKLYSIDAVFPTEANSGKLSAKSQSTESSHFNSAEYARRPLSTACSQNRTQGKENKNSAAEKHWPLA